MTDFNVEKIRQDFPILSQKVNGKPLVYFDSAASSLKPTSVIERMNRYYREETSNIHRSAHYLGSQGTASYEGAREKARAFVGAKSASEIIFTRGTTESINLVAQSYGQRLAKGDEILVTELEHHSNIVPWQLVAERVGARVRAIPMTVDGDLDFAAFRKLLSPKTKILALTMCSNTLGSVIDVEKYITAAHEQGAVVLLDAAQAAAHQKLDVQKLNCDFLALSGHKIYAPFGIGILYGRESLLEQMPPYQGGGSMISEVTFEQTTYADLPQKFEAGTPAIADAIGLGAAIDYLNGVNLTAAEKYLADLRQYTLAKLSEVPGVKILGPKSGEHAPIVGFTVEGLHPSDIGSIVDQEGVAIRTGHHCTQPLHRKLGITASCRASFSIYNTKAEVDTFIKALVKAKELLS